jgi:hypothetical protein
MQLTVVKDEFVAKCKFFTVESIKGLTEYPRTFCNTFGINYVRVRELLKEVKKKSRLKICTIIR